MGKTYLKHKLLKFGWLIFILPLVSCFQAADTGGGGSSSPVSTPTSGSSGQPNSAPSSGSTQSGSVLNITGRTRGMWVWNSDTVLTDMTQQSSLVSEAQAANVTDIFLSLGASDYTSKSAQLRAFNAKMNQAGIRVWGLDGDRSYFSDIHGPAALYAAADNLIAYNANSASNERFVGFHTDMEPQDGQGNYKTTFHNNLPDSKLSTTSGGVWYSTQAQDREMLMRDWLNIHQTLNNKLHAANLRLGAAMVNWTENYYGEQVQVTYNGSRQGVMKFMMQSLDDYAIMSYSTSPSGIISRVVAQLQYADTLPPNQRPRVYAGVETHQGAGSGVSYGDNSSKNSKSAVLADIETVETTLTQYHSYSGTNLHDWEGWEALK